MQNQLRQLLATVLCLTVLGCGSDAFGPVDDRAGAIAVAEQWVREHPAGWSLDVRSTAALWRPAWTPACPHMDSNGYVSLRMSDGNTQVELAFRCPLSPSATVEELTQQFRFAIPSALPTGLRAAGWSFQTTLENGAVYEDVEITKRPNGELRIDVVARLTAIIAQSRAERCADEAAALEREVTDGRPLGDSSCRIVRRHRVPVRITLYMPGDLAALR